MTTLPITDEGKRLAYYDLLHWLWSCQLQRQRLAESTEMEQKALGESAQVPPRVFSRTSFDGHILVVAARGFLLAMGRCPDLLAGFPLDEPKKAAITALRNIYEHWDEYLDDYRASRPLVGKSGRAFANRSPHGKPWSMEYGGKGPVLAGVLVLKDFAAILSDLEPKAIAIRERLIEERERLRQSSKAP